jgi:hypothetical protein
MMMVVMMVVILSLCGWGEYPKHQSQREHCEHSAFHLHKLSYKQLRLGSAKPSSFSKNQNS